MVTDIKPQITSNELQDKNTPRAGARTLAVLRIALAGIFLWPVLDKTFGLGLGTPAGSGWIDGGSPTTGYLSHQEGTFAAFFTSMSGNVLTDIGFIGGLAAVSIALLLGIGLRLAAFGGTIIMGMLWMSVLPLETNPFLDSHVIYIAALIALAATRAGDTWGLGKQWAATKLVTSVPLLR